MTRTEAGSTCRNRDCTLVLIRDPYEEPSYDDICYVCDGDHLDGFVGRLHDAGFPLEDIRVVRCAVNERIDWDRMDRGTHRAP